MNRSITAAAGGVTCIIVGLIVRANARSWSIDNVRHSFDEARYLLLQDVGLVLLGLGVLALAVALNRWIAEKPPLTK